ncbi:MAG: 4'-phosphopantetheinyl transferase superfamily protein [Ferruginibacter sp.]
MPLVYQQNINACTKLGVWHIAEEEQFFSKRIHIQQNITNPHKRLQHMGGRLVLTELFPDFPVNQIQIAVNRKPFLPNHDFQFSISHCGEYAAAIVSRENRVGVDIEIPQTKITNIQHKYLNDSELQLLHQYPHQKLEILTLAWSVKEAVFKWYAEGNVDFKEHIQIESIYFSDNQFTASCSFKKHDPVALKVNGIFFNGNCLSWLVTY